VLASRAASGSSSSSIRGPIASARASATRCACPPDSSRGPRSGVWGETDLLEPVARLAARIGLGDAPRSEPERDVVEGGQVLEQEVLLEHHADRAAFRRNEDLVGGVVEHDLVDANLTAVDRQQTGECAQHGGLAGPVGTEDCEHLARLDVDVDIEAERPEAESDVGVERHRSLLVVHMVMVARGSAGRRPASGREVRRARRS
jgi:hypothetical protein